MLKPQDIMILLKIAADGWGFESYPSLAFDLGMSASEVHAGVHRAAHAGLLDLQRRAPIAKALEEFLVHGVRYAFPPKRGSLVRGMPTGYAAPPLNALIAQSDEPPPVWPDAKGSIKGISFAPLYSSAPHAAQIDHVLYEYLALVDALRGGKARERKLAAELLNQRLYAARDHALC